MFKKNQFIRFSLFTRSLDCSGVRMFPSLQIVWSFRTWIIPRCRLVGKPSCLNEGSIEWINVSGNGPSCNVTVYAALVPALGNSGSEYFWNHLNILMNKITYIYLIILLKS